MYERLGTLSTAFSLCCASTLDSTIASIVLALMFFIISIIQFLLNVPMHNNMIYVHHKIIIIMFYNNDTIIPSHIINIRQIVIIVIIMVTNIDT